jgi:predicted Zn-dependent protease
VRRLLVLVLLVACAAGAQDKQGVEVKRSSFMLLPASTVEKTASQQYGQMMRAAQQKDLLNKDLQQLDRLRVIARQLVPHSARFNKDAEKWRWEVNLISSKNVNAFCMPGGKIAFFTGILEQLKLTDDEVAAVMGHEIAHALLEHGRARMSTEVARSVGITIVAAVFNLGQLSAEVLNQAAHYALSLPYARGMETDSDLVGMELAARAGYDPRAAAEVWRKMQKFAQAAGKNQPPQFLSTHPAHETRIGEIEKNLPRVMPLYEAARGK